MSTYRNPYPETENDRRELWEMLVARDTEALASADWAMVADDFVSDGFVVIDANGTIDTSTWTVAFSDIESYSRAWLRRANGLRRTRGQDGVRRMMRERSRLARIDIAGEAALVEKTIGGLLWSADEPDRHLRATTTVCHLRRVDGRWRVTSILSRLPVCELEAEAAGPPTSKPSHFVSVAAIR